MTEESADSNPQPTTDGARWPGVNVAYDVAMDSYELVGRRPDAANGRIQALLGFVATTTLAAPVIVRSIEESASFDSAWFIVAVVIAILTFASGIVAINYGSLVAFSPEILYERWLDWPEWEFKKNAIYWAGRHFKLNTRLLDRKGQAAALLTVLYFAETACLLVWALSET